ncbi:MAG: ATP-binding protein [Candidatus Freyarchaeota archaeon]
MKKETVLWGLSEIPFTEKSTFHLEGARINKVFTGREKELSQIETLLNSSEPKSIFILGYRGIGKTALIIQALSKARKQLKNVLIAYTILPEGYDLSTTAFIALALRMKFDPWVQHMLSNMGIPVYQTRETEMSVNLKWQGFGYSIKDTPAEINIKEKNMPFAFEELLELAYKKYKYEKVVIAIDDLDKKEPAKYRNMIRDAQGVLKSRAWFLLSGHPYYFKRDIITSELGISDLVISLSPLSEETMHKMLVNYLNSVRVFPIEQKIKLLIQKAFTSRGNFSESLNNSYKPFTIEAASELCKRSNGIPRHLNRIGMYVMMEASDSNAQIIDHEILENGIAKMRKDIHSHGDLTQEDQYVLQLILEKGELSDRTVTLNELSLLGLREFNQLFPILDKLVELDLLIRIPSEIETKYIPSGLIYNKK